MEKITTNVYFIRHAESDNTVRDGRIRPLTPKGLADCSLVTNYLNDKNIDMVFSSPFKRAVDTVSDFALKNNLEKQSKIFVSVKVIVIGTDIMIIFFHS